MMRKCLIVLLAFIVALSDAISDDDRNTIIEALNDIRGGAGGINMRKLIYNDGVKATATTDIAAADCNPTLDVTKNDWIIKGDTLAAALTSSELQTEINKGKTEYEKNVDCSGTTSPTQCKVYRTVVNAESNKVNCDLATCMDDETTPVKHQVIKCVFDPAYEGNGAAFLPQTCSACGTGYKCCPDNAKLCCVDPDAGKSGGSGVSQLTQNVCLVGLALLCSMLFI